MKTECLKQLQSSQKWYFLKMHNLKGQCHLEEIETFESFSHVDQTME